MSPRCERENLVKKCHRSEGTCPCPHCASDVPFTVLF